MPIPISIEKLLYDRVVEGTRIDYKADWNPEPVVHTICAFANDIDNQGGGYIILGIEDENGMPKFPIKGLNKASIDNIFKDIINKCNLIEPRYIPIIESQVFQEKDIIILWVPGGAERPYRCPTAFPNEKNHKSDKAYYIRKGSSTIKANMAEERELFQKSTTIPFDDRINYEALPEDIQNSRIDEFLLAVDSKLYTSFKDVSPEMKRESLCLVRGPKEMLHPVNVGLMFFNDNPERFFPYSRIEIVYKPDPTGKNMQENIFSGPLDRQLTNALNLIQSRFIIEQIEKNPDKAKAKRFYNYPYAAIEESLSNAVYHKSYQIREPITVTITDETIEVTSFPGPDRSISDEDIKNFHLVSNTYMNRRIGDFLKELKLAEGRNTGIPTILYAMKDNGSPMPVIKTDQYRTYFKMILPIHNGFKTKVTEKPKKNRRKNGSIKIEILDLLANNGAMSSSQLANALGYNSIPGSLIKAIKELLSEEKIEYTIPEQPNSSYQRLRIKWIGK